MRALCSKSYHVKDKNVTQFTVLTEKEGDKERGTKRIKEKKNEGRRHESNESLLNLNGCIH
jgi:hypothetical protein